MTRTLAEPSAHATTAHATTECSGCDWERHPQAYRWFPELGEPVRAALPTENGAEPRAAVS